MTDTGTDAQNAPSTRGDDPTRHPLDYKAWERKRGSFLHELRRLIWPKIEDFR